MSRKRATIVAGTVGIALAGLATASQQASAAANGKATQQATVRSARHLLTSAEQELDDARRTATLIREQAAAGRIDPEVLAALQPVDSSTYRPGAPEIELIAGLLSDTAAATTLRQASIADLATLTPPQPEITVPSRPVVVTTPQQAIRAAENRIVAAQDEKADAQALIKQLSGQTRPAGPGAAKLADLCADVGVVVAVCQPVRWNEAHLQFDTVMIGRTVNVLFPDIKTVGGYRPYDPYPDHPSGRAADIMMPNGGAGPDVKLGNEIARYFQQHAREYGIYYMLWRQQMWKLGDPVGSWTGVSDRGDPTSNHMDHVHITVSTGHDGTAWRERLKDAREASQT